MMEKASEAKAGVLAKLGSINWEKTRMLLYATQAVLVTIAWILTIYVLAQSGDTGGAVKYYFFLTWICIPALLYLAVLPLWGKYKKYSNIYANAAIDVVFTILWLGAFAGVESWVQSGIQDKSKGCSQFDFGSENKCDIGHGDTIIGFFIFLIWMLASAISVYTVMFYRKSGYIPGSRPSISDPSFSAYPPASLGINGTTPAARPEYRPYRERQDLEYGSVHTETSEGLHPGRALSIGFSPRESAPPRYSPVQFNTVYYGEGPRNSTQPLSLPAAPNLPTRYANPVNRFGPRSDRFTNPPNRYATPPPIHISQAALSYTSGALSANGHAPQDYRRQSIARLPVRPGAPLPGPASLHVGGYESAYHTPLPTGLAPQRNYNTWRVENTLDGVTNRLSDGRLAYPKADYSR